jgi:hypothetical protein
MHAIDFSFEDEAPGPRVAIAVAGARVGRSILGNVTRAGGARLIVVWSCPGAVGLFCTVTVGEAGPEGHCGRPNITLAALASSTNAVTTKRDRIIPLGCCGGGGRTTSAFSRISHVRHHRARFARGRTL